MDAQTELHEPPPLPHRERLWVVLGVLLPLFLSSLDNTILASALPTIGRDLGDANNLSWLITAYLLAATACLPLYGKLADIHGRLLMLRIAIGFFMAGALICALAPDIAALIFGRAVQGIGGGGMGAMAVVVLGDIAAPKDRGRYYTLFSITYTTAGACGPALGGSIADHLHWSMIFWINLPLGVVAWAMTIAFMRKLPRHERPHRLDVIGALLIVAASVSFMLALNLGGVRVPWTSPSVIALLAAAAAVAGLFIARMLTAPEPLIPLSILREPAVRCAVVAHGFGWASIIALNIFLPMYLQTALALSPTAAGLSLMVLMATLNTSAGLGGLVLCRVQHYKRLPVAAYLVAMSSVLALAWWAGRMDLWTFEVLIFLIGAGFGPMPSLAMVSMQNVVPRHQLGIAVGTTNFSRSLCGTMLVAVVGAVILASTASSGALGPRGLGGALAPGSEAATVAFQRVFFIIAACMAVAYVAILLLEERPLRTDMPAAPR